MDLGEGGPWGEGDCEAGRATLESLSPIFYSDLKYIIQQNEHNYQENR